MNDDGLLDTLEIDADGADATLIWCHGLGADGHDFAPIVEDLRARGLRGLRCLFPHAPMRSITLNHGMRMRGWYDIRSPNLLMAEDAEGITQSVTALSSLIKREVARGISSDRIVIGGFSQGCAMALSVGLLLDLPLAGIIGLSGYLPCLESTLAQRHPANLRTPIWLAHGLHDPIVALARGVAAYQRLSALGHKVQWHTYPIAHTVNATEFADLVAFLKQVLPIKPLA